MKNDNQSLSHTKWNCKYHIVFAPKYRRQAIYGKVREDIGKILRQLCELKKAELKSPLTSMFAVCIMKGIKEVIYTLWVVSPLCRKFGNSLCSCILGLCCESGWNAIKRHPIARTA